ncbi:unnamed protein product [Dovyalis caffra]|uniref:Uncharacterized protein n=1 Tax=Dovyalis caffra TaxID=77055 RepID=A0AAV1R5V3_9ROSI|nr:unnamed protein product [Dovyalis caffra]
MESVTRRAIILEDRGKESLSFVPFREKDAMPLNREAEKPNGKKREKKTMKNKRIRRISLSPSRKPAHTERDKD